MASKQFHCDECNLDFPSERSLKAHLLNAAQHNIKECVCLTCGKGFHNIKSRNRHQKTCGGVIKSLIEDGLIEEVNDEQKS